VTTAKRADFELIHEKRHIRQFMDFVLVREDHERAMPHPEPYLTGLKRFGATDPGRGGLPARLKSAVTAGTDSLTRPPRTGWRRPRSFPITRHH
jgi:hypothetical protein